MFVSQLPFYALLTANILGAFNDPFEFQGDYDPSIDTYRKEIFELVVSKEALAKNLSADEIRFYLQNPEATAQEITTYQNNLIQEASLQEAQKGPTLGQLVPEALLQELKQNQSLYGLTDKELDQFGAFITKFHEKNAFQFLRNSPKELLSLDKTLRDLAAQQGKNFTLPILSSTEPLTSKNIDELQHNLLRQLFSQKAQEASLPEETMQRSLSQLDPAYLQTFLGTSAQNRDLNGFTSAKGQVLFYWLYQSLNLYLVAQDAQMVDQVNKVKAVFAKTLGDPVARAALFTQKVERGNFGVVFTQESDLTTQKSLEEHFLPVTSQNPQDGTFVFLKKGVWNGDYEVLNIDNYPKFHLGKINAVIATSTQTGEQFLLASCHGNSTQPEDGRLQISLIKERFEEEVKKHPGLQLMIGIDANTKSEQEVQDLKELLQSLNLTATSVGPTTIKKRMVTVQHSKVGRAATDEEDFLITLMPSSGGKYQFTHPTVGFTETKPDLRISLPNRENPSDHYAIGAQISRF